MKRQPPTGDARIWSRCGFTLLELLTAIAIIGILAGILIPVVSTVRKSAQRSACVGNLRQIGVAMQLYARENKNTLPPAKVNSEGWPAGWWQDKLQPYLENIRNTDGHNRVFTGVFRCPGKPDWALSGVTDREKLSYGMNTFATYDASGALVSNQDVGRRLNTLALPSITMLVSDTAQGDPALRASSQLYGQYPAQWHRGNDNVLFVDGHVEAVPKNGLNHYLVKTGDSALRP